MFLGLVALTTLLPPHTLAHSPQVCSVSHADFLAEHNRLAVKAASAANPDSEQQDGGRNVFATEPATAGTSDEEAVTRQDDGWHVPGVGVFTKRAVYTFEGDKLPAGLLASDYSVDCRGRPPPNQALYNERFAPANVKVANGFLNLLVPGGQQPTSDNKYEISCAEVTTREANIQNGSFRTIAIFCAEPGTCHGWSNAQISHHSPVF